MIRLTARRFITHNIFAIYAYAALARGGIYRPLQWPLLGLALLLTLSVFLLETDRRTAFLERMRKDKIFWLGSLFGVLILCQWLNSNYWLVLTEQGEVEFVRQPMRWLPWSVDRADAGEILVWFFPVWVCLLFIRNLLHRKHLFELIYMMAAGSLVLACIGLLQVLTGSKRILGIWNQPYDIFFASFDYANHAAQWFYLSAFLAIGLLLNAYRAKAPGIQLASWSAVYLLCTVSIFFTLSRVGSLVAMALLVFGMVFFFRVFSRRSGHRGQVNVYLMTVIMVLLGTALFFGVKGGGLFEEFSQKTVVGESSVWTDFAARFDQYGPALEIFRDYPLFGSGGWGYRWLVKLYTSPEEWELWSGMGLANVHCDPMQYLCEFGLVGGALIFGMVMVLVKDVTGKLKHNVLGQVAAIGCFLVVLHSLVDLPFRNPAIIILWAIMISAAPRCGVTAQQYT